MNSILVFSGAGGKFGLFGRASTFLIHAREGSTGKELRFGCNTVSIDAGDFEGLR
jgi:hypothetical protein